MTKPRRRKRQVKRGGTGHRPTQPSKRTQARVSVPSAASLFRFTMLDPESSGLMDKATGLLKPLLWARDGGAVKQIRDAKTPQEILDLVPLATGLAESAWRERMRQVGPEVVPLISERLLTVQEIPDKDVRDMVLEKLIGALRWQGDAGAKVLIERFDGLGDYGQSLACVALGLLGARSAAGHLWRFYERVGRRWREDHFVGALWGLIDLQDERVGGALADLFDQGRDFYELYGFVSLAGDACTVIPLLTKVARESRENEHASMALVSISHRIGKEAFLAQVTRFALAEESLDEREAFAERFLSMPEGAAREYFGWFYRGLTEEDLEQRVPKQ